MELITNLTRALLHLIAPAIAKGVKLFFSDIGEEVNKKQDASTLLKRANKQRLLLSVEPSNVPVVNSPTIELLDKTNVEPAEVVKEAKAKRSKRKK